jgi:HEAT repeat protein
LNLAAKLGQQSSSAAIAPYVRHRSSVLREAAAHALVQTGGPAAVQGLRVGLRSNDATVRVISAAGLGKLGAREAVGDLFEALERQVFEAAISIGTMCAPNECKRLAGLLGKQPLSVMLRGLDQVLFRPAEQVPDDTKLSVIERLRELGTMEVGSYMASASQRWPKQWSKPVKEAIDTAAKALGASVEGK